jgi:hypothetical protein
MMRLPPAFVSDLVKNSLYFGVCQRSLIQVHFVANADDPMPRIVGQRPSNMQELPRKVLVNE